MANFPGMGGGMASYMNAMQGLMSNPGFMQMAEKVTGDSHALLAEAWLFHPLSRYRFRESSRPLA